jgi:hypothetical protein
MPHTYTVVITVPDKIDEDDDPLTKPELLTEVADQLEAVSNYLNTLVEDCDEDYLDGLVYWIDIDTQTTIKSFWNTPRTPTRRSER